MSNTHRHMHMYTWIYRPYKYAVRKYMCVERMSTQMCARTDMQNVRGYVEYSYVYGHKNMWNVQKCRTYTGMWNVQKCRTYTAMWNVQKCRTYTAMWNVQKCRTYTAMWNV